MKAIEDILEFGKFDPASGMENFECFIYFISYENGPIKIGKAKNVTSRLKTLQTSLPHKLKVLGIIPGRPVLESMLHGRFKHLRKSGEWFERSEEILGYIDRNTIALTPELEADARIVLFPKTQQDGARAAAKRISSSDVYEVYSYLRAKMLRGLKYKAGVRYGNFLNQHLIACQRLVELLNHIDEALAKDGKTLLSYRPIRMEVRRAIDDMFGVKWKDAEEILSCDDISDEIIRKRAEDLIGDELGYFLDDNSEAWKLCDKIAGLDELTGEEEE